LQSGIGTVTYLWNTGASGPSITVSEFGKYWLTVTDANGCTASDTVVIHWPDDVAIIPGTNTKVSIYPNPTNSQLNVDIESDQIAIYTVELINPQGMVVKHLQSIPTIKMTDNFNVEGLTPGIYLLRISTAKGSAVFKVIVNR